MYYHANNFNGILILLREPHVDNDDRNQTEDVIEHKSSEWIENVLNYSFQPEELAKMERREKTTISKFRNRFTELLEYIGKSGCISQIAYDNLQRRGGGATASKAYNEVLKKYEKEAFEKIVTTIRNKGGKLECVFTCKDIYTRLHEILQGNTLQDCSEKGIKYPSGKKQAMKYGNIIIYEIAHPSRSPKLEKLAK